MKTFNEEPKEWICSFSNKSLRLILFVTEQCNFRCAYCYENFVLGKIEDEVVEGIKNLINKRISELNSLQLSYFGGEPLLNKKAIIDISLWVKELCKRYLVNYIGDITTNGYSLDEKTFNELILSGVTTYQITIDGDNETHDKLRPTINGKPTFNKIINNLIMMANSRHQFGCILRFNVADTNLNSVKNFLNKYAHYFANDKRFSLHFHPIFGMPKLALTQEKKIRELQILAESLNLDHDGKNRDDFICYASKADSYVIRANGIVQKCTVNLKDDVNNIGKIFKDGTLQLDQEKLKKWIFAQNKACPLQFLALEKLAIPYSDAGKHTKAPPFVE